jgi:hypothetical protein
MLIGTNKLFKSFENNVRFQSTKNIKFFAIHCAYEKILLP